MVFIPVKAFGFRSLSAEYKALIESEEVSHDIFRNIIDVTKLKLAQRGLQSVLRMIPPGATSLRLLINESTTFAVGEQVLARCFRGAWRQGVVTSTNCFLKVRFQDKPDGVDKFCHEARKLQADDESGFLYAPAWPGMATLLAQHIPTSLRQLRLRFGFNVPDAYVATLAAVFPKSLQDLQLDFRLSGNGIRTIADHMPPVLKKLKLVVRPEPSSPHFIDYLIPKLADTLVDLVMSIDAHVRGPDAFLGT